MSIHYRFIALLALTAIVSCLPAKITAQPFIHPGIDQRPEDLAYMKKKVLAGEQPWKDAWERLKAAADTGFTVKVHTHVLRGPYGKPNIGGDDLSKSANMAYNFALAWYVTRQKIYADRAIAILNAWSPAIWDLDYNDAKLLAGWTGHLLCNAAEILRYTGAGWTQKDITAFSNMLMTVYFPLMRPYFPQANGNWDGAIIHSLIAIAIFTDNRPLYNNAVDHFRHAPVNGGILKYIYPNGQCQESPRDQGHVQLGIGEFAGAAQVAYTQGTDLFSMADNRIALGFEYTARFLLGETPYCYCTLSERSKVLRDDYEYVYRHYTAQGLDLPYTKRAADSVRTRASRSVLTAVRAWSLPAARSLPVTRSIPATRALATDRSLPVTRALPVKASTIAYIAGAAATSPPPPVPSDAIRVQPGQSIQQALDSAARTPGRWVLVTAGLHKFPATLKIPSGITLTGEGAATILFLDTASGQREAMINGDIDLHDLTIRDLVIEGSNRTDPGTDPNTNRSSKGGYNRGGILFRSDKEGQMQHIRLIDLTIRNATYSGISISGASDLTIDHCDLSENGGNVPPGPKLTHNLLLAHCSDVRVSGSRLVTSPSGSGLSLDHCNEITVTDCEIARNAWFGVLLAESHHISLQGNLIEANDRSGVMAEYLFHGNEYITISNNHIRYNNGYGVETYGAGNSKTENNIYEGNGNLISQQKISADSHGPSLFY